ncbi:hypothetical protein [Methyloferula stellata]|uniref:hypothetical protein n=1 Tax=Methyloferula stellata TaxID=876270 RepID=UPI001FCBE7A0|nr:hypothetical protein [Methyloferula stellata]
MPVAGASYVCVIVGHIKRPEAAIRGVTLPGFLARLYCRLVVSAIHRGPAPGIAKRNLAYIILAMGMPIPASNGDAATLTTLLTDKGAMIALKGDIALSDADALETRMRAAEANGHAIRGLMLDSLGGNLVGGLALARLVRAHTDLQTTVSYGATCASACFLVFAAGQTKFADYGSSVGIHGAADKSGRVTEDAMAATRAMARFSMEVGVPAPIAQKLINTPPDTIVWLSAADLRSMGVAMAGRPVQAPRGGPRPLVPAVPHRTADIVRNEPPPKSQSERIQAAFDAADHGDYAMATNLWRALADQDHGPSQYNLGQMYYAGKGVPQNFAEAVKWFSRAAQKGVPGAQLSLGVAYALGRGVQPNLTEAYKWLKLSMAGFATEKERMEALKAREMIVARMTAAEIAEAEKETREWAPSR